jgi:hypothetical protein
MRIAKISNKYLKKIELLTEWPEGMVEPMEGFPHR